MIIWFYSNALSNQTNEAWGTKFVRKQIIFDKYRTLAPIMHEIELVQQLAREDSVLQMALHDNDPMIRAEGLKTLEQYRLKFQDRSYFAAFVKSQNYYFNDSSNQFATQQLRYKLSPSNNKDKWFYETMSLGDEFQINVNKDNILGVTKIWIDYIIRDNGKIVGVIGTGFDFDQFLKQSVGIEQEGIKNFFINKNLAIQLAKDTGMIDYASMTKADGTHKTIDIIFKNSADIANIKKAMEEISSSLNQDDVKTLWVTIDGKKQLLGIAYQPKVGWFSLTLFDSNDLTLISNLNSFIILSLIFLIAIFILGIIMNLFLLTPINSLKQMMMDVSKGKYDIKIPIVGTGEIAELSEQFKRMVEKVHFVNQELEEKVVERTAHLKQSEQKFRSLFDFTHDAVMLLDEKGFFDCNTPCVEMFGCTSVEEFCKFHPADLSPLIQPCGTESIILASKHIQNALNSGYDRFEWVHQRAHSGEIFFADVLLSALEIGDRKVLQAVVRDDTERRKVEEEIRTLAFYDSLTNLPNRRLLADRIIQAQTKNKRSGRYGAVLFMDLDNFKPLNDTYGHTVGDLLLIEVAHRIKTCLRESDTVSRFGGDEFVVLLGELDERKEEAIVQASIIGEKIRLTLSHPYFLTLSPHTLEEKIVEHHCTTSIGITLFINHIESQDDIIKRADNAMYTAKEYGRNQIYFYTLDSETTHAESSMRTE